LRMSRMVTPVKVMFSMGPPSTLRAQSRDNSRRRS
jgi:hypothetical protein